VNPTLRERKRLGERALQDVNPNRDDFHAHDSTDGLDALPSNNEASKKTCPAVASKCERT
jgi:hypothetical protein